MVFGGKKGELLAVVDCGMNGPDSTKLESNAMRTRNKRNALCQPLRGSWWDNHSLFI